MNNIKGVLLLCILLVLVSCGSIKKPRLSPQPVTVSALPRTTLSENDRMRMVFFYQEATKQKIQGNYMAAFDLYQHCLGISPDAPEVLYDLSFFYQSLHQDSIALSLLCRAALLDPKNTYYKEALTNYYLEHNNDKEALVQLENLAVLEPQRSDILAKMTSLYIAQDRLEDAIRTLDRIEVLEGKMANVSYKKFSLYKQMNQDKKAFGELESLCREYPHEMSYRLTIGNQLLVDGRISEAEKVYEQVRKIDPDNANLKLSILELYHKTGKDSLYASMRDSMLMSQQTESQVRLALLRDYVVEKMEDDSCGRKQVLETFSILEERFPKDLGLLQIHAAFTNTYDKENESDFVEIMDRIIDLEPENTQALFFLIQYYGQHQDFPKLEALCRRGVLTHPEELICHYYLGIACYQQDKKTEAVQAFKNGILQKTPESRPEIVADLYCVMGDLLHEMEQKKESYAAYDSCLVYQDDNASCLNNYAYFLSLEERDLDRAEEMSYRAIRQEPNNLTYLDTYAWILFMKERYSEAQAYMDRICPPDSSDSVLLADPRIGGVVLEHAGDIAAMNEQTEKALRFWLLAEQAGGNGLTAVLPRKIKMKKYIK